MKQTWNSLTMIAARFDRRYIQFILLVLSVILLVIGAGAPVGGGEGNPGSGGG